MASLRSHLCIGASIVSSQHKKQYAKYIKHKKPSPITRDEKKVYFEENDYKYEHVETYYDTIKKQHEILKDVTDENEKLHKIYSKCFSIITLISEGNIDPSS